MSAKAPVLVSLADQIVQALRILLDAKTPQVSQWTRAHYRHALACVIQVELEVRANNAEEVQQQYQQAQQYLNKKYPTCVFATLDSLHDAQHEFCFTLMVNPNTPSAIYETLLCDWSLSNHADESAEEIFVRDFVQACRTAAESDILGDIVHTLYQAEKPRVIARPDSVQGLEAYLLDPDHQVELMLARDILKRCHAMPKDEAINMFHTCIVDTEDVNERLMLLAASNVLLECEEFPADFSCDARIQIKMLVESLEETVMWESQHPYAMARLSILSDVVSHVYAGVLKKRTLAQFSATLQSRPMSISVVDRHLWGKHWKAQGEVTIRAWRYIIAAISNVQSKRDDLSNQLDAVLNIIEAPSGSNPFSQADNAQDKTNRLTRFQRHEIRRRMDANNADPMMVINWWKHAIRLLLDLLPVDIRALT